MVGVWVRNHTHEEERTVFVRAVLSSMWVPGKKLRYVGLAATTFAR